MRIFININPPFINAGGELVGGLRLAADLCAYGYKAEIFSLREQRITSFIGNLGVAIHEFDIEADDINACCNTLRSGNPDLILFFGELGRFWTDIFFEISKDIPTLLDESTVFDSTGDAPTKHAMPVTDWQREVLLSRATRIRVHSNERMNMLPEYIARQVRIITSYSYRPLDNLDTKAGGSSWMEVIGEIAAYKGHVERLFEEQIAIDFELATHARRVNGQLLSNNETEIVNGPDDSSDTKPTILRALSLRHAYIWSK